MGTGRAPFITRPPQSWVVLRGADSQGRNALWPPSCPPSLQCAVPVWAARGRVVCACRRGMRPHHRVTRFLRVPPCAPPARAPTSPVVISRRSQPRRALAGLLAHQTHISSSHSGACATAHTRPPCYSSITIPAATAGPAGLHRPWVPVFLCVPHTHRSVHPTLSFDLGRLCWAAPSPARPPGGRPPVPRSLTAHSKHT